MRVLDVKQLRVGYVKSAFEKERDNQANDAETLRVLKCAGDQTHPDRVARLPVRRAQHHPVCRSGSGL